MIHQSRSDSRKQSGIRNSGASFAARSVILGRTVQSRTGEKIEFSNAVGATAELELSSYYLAQWNNCTASTGSYASKCLLLDCRQEMKVNTQNQINFYEIDSYHAMVGAVVGAGSGHVNAGTGSTNDCE